MNMQEKADSLNLLNLIADKYNLTINWDVSSVDNMYLEFNGGTEDEIDNFTKEVQEFLNNVID